MTAYTRQSTYTDGDVITAAHTNDEFDRLVTVFNNTSGHAHDGTAGEGPVIGLIGDPGIATPLNKVVVDDTNNRVGLFIDAAGAGTSVEQLRFQDGLIVPVTTNDVDLGTSSLQFKDLYLDGTATIDGLAMPTTTVTDILDEDTMSSDSATALATQQSIKAYVDSQVTAQDLDFQGDSGGALNIDLDSETLTIAGGTGIDTTGSGNTLTIDIDSTVATLTGTQTLTNKTLTTPVISTISNTGTITLPTSTDTLVGRATTDTLTNKTLTSPTITTGTLNGNISGTSIKDEDNMVSDSANHLATQQSIKAYVDSQIAGIDELVEDTTPQLGGDLDVNGQKITSASNGDIDIEPNGTGNVLLGNFEFDVDQTVGASQDDYILRYDHTTGHISLEAEAASGLSDIVSDTTPQLGGDLDTNSNNITFGDSATPGTDDTLIFGAGSDMSMYWDGTDGHLEVAGTLNIDGSGETLAKFVDDGAVELYYNNIKKIETTSGGISVTGDITVSGNVDGKDVSQLMSDLVDDTSPQLGGKLETVGNSIDFADNGQAIFGTGDDMKIYHDGTHSYILDAGGTGDLYLGSNSGVHLFKYLSSEKMLSAIPDGAVELYYDNNKKLETVTGGVTVTGTLSATAVTGDGSGLTNLPASGDGGIAMAIALG